MIPFKQDRKTAYTYIEKMLRDLRTSRLNVVWMRPETSIFLVMQQLANGLGPISLMQRALSMAHHAKDDKEATAALEWAIESHHDAEEHRKDALAILHRWLSELSDIQLAISIMIDKPGNYYFTVKELAMFMALPTDVRMNLVASMHPVWRSNERRCECSRTLTPRTHGQRLSPNERQYIVGPIDRLMVQPHRCLHCTGIVENARAVPNSTIFGFR